MMMMIGKLLDRQFMTQSTSVTRLGNQYQRRQRTKSRDFYRKIPRIEWLYKMCSNTLGFAKRRRKFKNREESQEMEVRLTNSKPLL